MPLLKFRLRVIMLCLIILLAITLYVLKPTLTRLDTTTLMLANVNASLTPNGRYFMFTACNTGDVEVELNSLLINGSKIFTWIPDKTMLKPGENTAVKVFFYWLKGKIYNITLTAKSGDYVVSSSYTIQTPMFSDVFNVDVVDVYAESINGELVKVNVQYFLKALGYSDIFIKLFTFIDYVSTSLPIYVFYDYRYMSRNTSSIIDVFVEEAGKHGLNITKADWKLLEGLALNRSRCILIIFYPLSSVNNPFLIGGLPACIIDPNHSQGIADNSRYGKSLIYDWMRDYGLIFITIGPRASQPNTWILYEDGYAKENLDKFSLDDSYIYFTDANKPIFAGYGGIGNYLGSRIAETLGLHMWKGDWGFDIDAMAKMNIKFYSYSNWRLIKDGEVFNLSMPCFIRVGKGGWLCLDNYFHPLPTEAIVSDLISIIQHSLWDKEWYPTGWMYDSSYTYESGHKVSKSNVLTVTIPNPTAVKGKFILVAVGYSRDSDSYTYITAYGSWSLK